MVGESSSATVLIFHSSLIHKVSLVVPCLMQLDILSVTSPTVMRQICISLNINLMFNVLFEVVYCLCYWHVLLP